MRHPLTSKTYDDGPTHRFPVVLVPSVDGWPQRLPALLSLRRNVYVLNGRDGWDAQDLLWALDVHRLSHAHLVACSLSCDAALDAASASTRVRSLALIADACARDPTPRVRAALCRAHALHMQGFTRASVLHRAHALAYPERLRTGEVLRRRIAHDTTIPWDTWNSAVSVKSSRVDLIPSLLRVHGTADGFAPRTDAEWVGMGHYLSEVRAPHVASCLRAFWTAVEAHAV